MAKSGKNRGRRDETVLAGMGLEALVVAQVERSAPVRRLKPSPGGRPERYAVATARLQAVAARKVEAIRAKSWAERPAGLVLAAMEPGRAYVERDLAKALRPRFSRSCVSAYLWRMLPAWGLVERIAAPPGMKHRGVLSTGELPVQPVKWLFRLTEAGIAARAEAVQGLSEGGPLP